MIRRTLYLLLMFPWLASCSETDEQNSLEKKLISVSFEDSAPTRAAAGTSALVKNALIKVYAYNQGTTITNSNVPLAEGTYKVISNGGLSSFEAFNNLDLKLYAGNYDLYFVSYNAPNEEAPSVGLNSSLISAMTNGKDFLYTSMRNIGIRSDNPGDTKCLVTLNQPFQRLCASLQLKVKAKESGHPIIPNAIKLVSAKIENLSSTRSFLLGDNRLGVPAGYTEYYDFNEFTGNDTSSAAGSLTTATPTTEVVRVLPTDGAKALKVTITLAVSYVDNKGMTHPDENYIYEIITNKALMPGMFYQFIFTLTFYGNYLPDNLELDILPYMDAPLNTGQVGG